MSSPPQYGELPSWEEYGINDPNDSTLDYVSVDGLVALKIVNHCKENAPDTVTGQLLGLDFDRNLEVTNCFPFPGKSDEDEPDSGVEYQIEMMRCLREVNVDHYTVGWYQSTYLESFLSESMVETQYNYQTTIKKCVLLIYDALKTSHGALSLKAYRLTQDFMGSYKKFVGGSDLLQDFSFNDIFEEVPIRIQKSAITTRMLYDIEALDSLDSQFSSLQLSTNSYLSKNMEYLIECIDDLGAEQNKFQYYQKAVARQNAMLQKRKDDEELNMKQLQPPSRLESLLITNQIGTSCAQINRFAGDSLAKLTLLGKAQQDTASP